MGMWIPWVFTCCLRNIVFRCYYLSLMPQVTLRCIEYWAFKLDICLPTCQSVSPFLNAFQHLRKVDTNFLISGRRIHACLGMPNYGGKYLLMPLDCLMGLMWLKIKYDQRWRHLNKVKSVSNASFVVFFSANLLSLKVIKRSCWFFACGPHFRSVWQDLLTCAQIFVKSPNLLVDCLMSFVVLKQPRLQD